MVEQAGSDVETIVTVQGGPDLSRSVLLLKWSTFINDGYKMYVRIFDPNLSLFQELTNIRYLKEARKEPLSITFNIGYRIGITNGKARTETRIAYVTNLIAKVPSGTQTAGFFEFVAIDPPTWFLSRGDAAGAVYTGNVSDVIKQIISKYAPGIEADVSTTADNKANKWWQMRQDPKTFMMTLLDWSSSVTNNKTNWVVASVDEKILIREQAELQTVDLGEYSVNVDYPAAKSVDSWEREDNNFLSNLQTRMYTGGISAISGLYCSPTNSITEDLTIVEDENTSAKKNVRITDEQGFSKPDDKDFGITFINSIPEHNSGDVGIQYQRYIDGRARGLFIGSLDMLNRVRVRVHGAPKLDDSSDLGASVVTLLWVDSEGQPWTGQGTHLVYGFEHVFLGGKWHTDIFLNRKDFNASASIVSLDNAQPTQGTSSGTIAT